MQMDIIVFGLMRSGTSLTCDLPTHPGKSVIFSEPWLLAPLFQKRADRMHSLARGVGLEVGGVPPTQDDHATLAD